MREFYARQKWVCSGNLWCNSVNADPHPPWKFTRAPMSFCLFVCSSVLRFSVFLPVCPHVPPAHLSIRLLDLLPVPHCSTISLSYRHSVFTLRLSVRTWQSICLLTRVCFSKLIFYIFYYSYRTFCRWKIRWFFNQYNHHKWLYFCLR